MDKTIAWSEIEQIFGQLVKTMNSVFWIYSPEGEKFVYVSPAYAQIWGNFPDQLDDAFSMYLDSIHSQDREQVKANLTRTGQGEQTELEYRIFDQQKNLHWIQTEGYPVLDEQGSVIYIVGISSDITERKHTQLALEEVRIIYTTLAESVPVGLYQNDAQGNCIYINKKTSEILDITFEECLGHGWVNRLYPDDAERMLKSWTEAFSKKTFWQEEYRFLHRDGTIVWVMAQCVFIFNEQGESIGSIGALTDITERKKLENQIEYAKQELEKLVNLDPLTNIYNRRYFDEVLGREWERLTREKRTLSLIMIDLDYFKPYNDNYGHVLGDKTLKLVAQTLAKLVQRPSDLVARYGGEEFAIILPNTDAEGAKHIANSIALKFREMAIPHHYSSVGSYITLSMGISTLIPNQEQSPKTLINQADKALYFAKSKGRNQIKSFDILDCNLRLESEK